MIFGYFGDFGRILGDENGMNSENEKTGRCKVHTDLFFHFYVVTKCRSVRSLIRYNRVEMMRLLEIKASRTLQFDTA